jgi:hypothetical protein
MTDIKLPIISFFSISLCFYISMDVLELCYLLLA